MARSVYVIGAGLAGCEIAWQLARHGICVELYEMRPVKMTPAHITSGFAELVCSNSFRSDDIENAVGLLHEEMRKANSLILKCADMARIPAGSALAVDRNLFSSLVEEAITGEKMITIKREELRYIPEDKITIIATGPLTSDALSAAISACVGQEHLAFFDAISPIIYKNSIDFSIAWYQSRYDKGDSKDYINCPLTQVEYENFVDSLLRADKVEFKDWERSTPYFNGCLPIEVMAERGLETLRFGPMKPVGLTNQHNPTKKPYAVVQLRPDNKIKTLYNLVGFQTKLKYEEQKRVLRQIPGLQNAEFARLGGLHRNTFINSPKLLDGFLRLKSMPRIRFAGQITGVEGYLESAAIGLLTALFTAQEVKNVKMVAPPPTTALGALLRHITCGANSKTFQPMNVNFGLFDPLEHHNKKNNNKRALFSSRALASLQTWLEEINHNAKSS